MITVVDKEYIDNINWSYLFSIEMQYDQFNKQVVLQDGRITEVVTQFKHIKEKR